MHSDWTLRVPVIRPRLAAWIDAAAAGAAAGALAVSLCWLGLHPLACAAVGFAAWAACRFMPARTDSRASAMLVARDGAFYVRLPQGWQPLELRRSWRGPRCLTLGGRIPAAACHAGTGRGAPAGKYVTLTLWQDALGQSAWRRACLLAGRNMRRVASRSVPESA